MRAAPRSASPSSCSTAPPCGPSCVRCCRRRWWTRSPKPRPGARERSLAGWLLALIVGVAVFALVPTPDVASRPGPAASPAPAAGTPVDEASDAAAGPMADPDPATLELQRRELAAAIATLPMVATTLWTTASNLEVILVDTREDPVAEICPLVERYPALASSRIQLTPPPGSDRPVRFRQCRSY